MEAKLKTQAESDFIHILRYSESQGEKKCFIFHVDQE